MSTVQLSPGTRHHTSPQVTREVDAWRGGGNVITDASAGAIAAWWQAPSGVGRHLATLASGLPVDIDDLRDDIAATMPEADGADRDALNALDTWAVISLFTRD
jgi:hypothetical protein